MFYITIILTYTWIFFLIDFRTFVTFGSYSEKITTIRNGDNSWNWLSIIFRKKLIRVRWMSVLNRRWFTFGTFRWRWTSRFVSNCWCIDIFVHNPAGIDIFVHVNRRGSIIVRTRARPLWYKERIKFVRERYVFFFFLQS